MKKINPILPEFFNEILLYSGQYALFYILMNFTKDKLNYFTNFGHTMLLVILIIQTFFLVRYGTRPLYRFLGSLIAPLIYTLLELREGLEFAINIGHLFFWIFSLLTGAMQAFELKTPNRKVKTILEYGNTIANVTIFLFIHFYFDLSVYYDEQMQLKKITLDEYNDFLEIYNLNKGLGLFFGNKSNTFLVLGGIFLSISLAVGRVKIIELKDKINELFGKYVDKGIRDKILSAREDKSESKAIAILFSDIRDFTTISENHTPDEITKMLNYYFTEWDRIVSKHNGVIDKYIGDAIMVLFGIDDNSKACDNAVLCATDMLKNLGHVRKGMEERKLPVIKNIGVGINFGNIIIGDIGSEDRKNYTVIGDNVNIASRLESQCKVYSTELIISESVHGRLSEQVKKDFTFLDNTELKGKAMKIGIYGRIQRYF